MKRKKWILGIAAVLLAVFAVKGISHYRWSQLSTAEKAGTLTEKMARHYDLTDTQKGRLYALNLEKVQDMEAACQSGASDRKAWKQRRNEWRDQVEAIVREK